MINIIFDAQTGEKTIIDVPDEEILEEVVLPTIEERLSALEKLELERMFEL